MQPVNPLHDPFRPLNTRLNYAVSDGAAVYGMFWNPNNSKRSRIPRSSPCHADHAPFATGEEALRDRYGRRGAFLGVAVTPDVVGQVNDLHRYSGRNFRFRNKERRSIENA